MENAGFNTSGIFHLTAISFEKSGIKRDSIYPDGFVEETKARECAHEYLQAHPDVEQVFISLKAVDNKFGIPALIDQISRPTVKN